MLKLFQSFALTILCLLVWIPPGNASAKSLALPLDRFTSSNLGQLVAYEYWFDNDGPPVYVPISPTQELQLDTDLPTTSLTFGLHTLHIRFLDDRGVWSGVLSQFFIKSPPAQGGNRQIVAYQYWFDQASAEALEVPVNPADEVTVLTDLPTTGLSNGLHTLHLRFKDDTEQWSGVLSQFFIKSPPAQGEDRQIVAYQYWFDEAPAKAVEVPVSPASEVTVLTDLPTTGLSNGLHTLHLRFKDDTEQWSSVLSQFFIKSPPAQGGDRQIVAYRYWFDQEADQATEVAVVPAEELTVLTDLPTSGLSDGLHTLHLRFKDDAGQWSGVLSQFFIKSPLAQGGDRQIVAYRYWFDQASDQAVEVPVSPASEVTVLTGLPTTGLSNGLHTLHLRFKDDAGQWGSILSQFFIKSPPAQGVDRQIVAYQYWFDQASAEAVTTAINPAPEVDLLIDIPTPGLDIGTHTLHLRFRDDRGIWSGVTTDTFSIPDAPSCAPTFDFSDAVGFEDNLVRPQGGSPQQTYQFEVRYFDASGALPQAGYPKLFLDFEGDGNLLGLQDQTYTLTEKDPTDLDVINGKAYFVILKGLPASPYYKTSVRAINTSGCQGVFGPFNGPVIADSVDLFLFANDIQLSDVNPEPLDAITVTATIHNESNFAAENFHCLLTNMNTNQVFPAVTVAFLPPGSSTQVSWNIITPPDPGWNPLKVEIDVYNVIAETNELNNQAIRAFINGDYQLAGRIKTTASVQPNPSLLLPETQLSLDGLAVYEGLPISLADSSCAGATVAFQILETGQTFSGFTDRSGRFTIYFPQPVAVGTYHITGTVTDYTLESPFSATFTILPSPCEKPDLYLHVLQEKNTIVQGEGLNGVIRVYNSGKMPSQPTQVRLSRVSGPPAEPILLAVSSPLDSGNFVEIPFAIAPVLSVGNVAFRAEVDFQNVVDECSETNNTALFGVKVIPELPDIIPTWFSRDGNSNPIYQCDEQTFIYRVDNRGATPTGPFTVTWTVVFDEQVEAQLNQIIPNIPRDSFYFITFRHQFLLANASYKLLLSCDALDEVTEYDESNNLMGRSIFVSLCPAPVIGVDLSFSGCPPGILCPQLIPDPVAPDATTITLHTTVYNKGNIPVDAPFVVDLLLEDESQLFSTPVIYTLSVGEDILPCAGLDLSFTIPKPQERRIKLSLKADARDELPELLETNNSSSSHLGWNFRLGNFGPGSKMFWERPITSQNIWFSIGLYNDGEYMAEKATVRFEVQGPGLAGWVNIGEKEVSELRKSCPGPIAVVAPEQFTFLTAGTYLVRMTVDPEDHFPEWDETDNVLTVQVKVLPDMRVLSQYIAPSTINPDPDEPVQFTVTYENIGFSNLQDEMELHLEVDGVPFAARRVPGLLTGDQYSYQFPATWSSSVIGPHVVRTIIDRLEEVEESNESNNEATRIIIVGEAPNMRFVSFSTDKPKPSLGEILVVTAVVENNGALAGTATYQLSYEDDSGNFILLQSRTLNLSPGNRETILFPWIVSDTHTRLRARIVNASPQETTTADNEVFAIVGGLELAIRTSPEYCVPYTGEATVEVSGGTAPYFVFWSTGQTGNSISGLGAGSYAVSVTDASGLEGVENFQIKHKLQPELSFEVTEATCNKNDGAVSVEVEYAKEPFSLLWGNGQTSAELSNLAPALYTLTVTDALGCRAEGEVIVGLDFQNTGDRDTCLQKYPNVLLSHSQLEVEETQDISGINFLPNGKARLVVNGESGILLDIELPTDAQGAFEYHLDIPSETQPGQFRAFSKDLVSGLATEKYFEVMAITPPSPAPEGIRIIYPYKEETFEEGTIQTIEWEEKILRKLNAPIILLKYALEISISEGPWEPLGNPEGGKPGIVEGHAFFGETINASYQYKVPQAGSTYRIRVVDSIDLSNVAISEKLSSIPYVPLVGTITLKWDDSYPQPGTNPKGVAADGTSRIYLQLASPNIESVIVTMEDPDNANNVEPRFLGKVMMASVTNSYSEEANAANAISAAFPNVVDTATFWYVAPDDFVRKTQDTYVSERHVNAVFQVTLKDGTVRTKTKFIRIVRPPLMLVHGLGGNQTSWDNFGGILDDSRYRVKIPVRISPNDHFFRNAGIMVLDSNKVIPDPHYVCQECDFFGDEKPTLEYPCFPCVIDEMRKQGFAANRVDYVGHSMGGSVLREVLTSFTEQFYRNGIAESWNYKNYQRGYTNKVITIGTPHQGSLLADILTRLLERSNSTYETLESFKVSPEVISIFAKTKTDVGETLEASNAVKDLQIIGGNEFIPASIKAHVIAGDFIPGYQSSTSSFENSLIVLDKFEAIADKIDLFKLIINSFEASRPSNDPLLIRAYDLYHSYVDFLPKKINQWKKFMLVLKAFHQAIQSGVVDFLPESDVVVSIESQIGGRKRPTETFQNPLVTVVPDVVHSWPLNYAGLTIELRSPIIAETVKSLLNDSINSLRFGPLEGTLDMTPPPPVQTVASTLSKPIDPNFTCSVSASLSDRNRIAIVSPSPATACFTDAYISIQVDIQDTLGLRQADVFFQGYFFPLPNDFKGVYQLDIPVQPNKLDAQEIIVIANYARNDSCIEVVDRIPVQVLPSSPITGFDVFSDIQYVFKGRGIIPNYRVFFPNSHSGDEYFSSSIGMVITDPSVLWYDSTRLSFVGVQPGETTVAFRYGGFTDTILFVVMPLLEDLPTGLPPVARFSFLEDTECFSGNIDFKNESLHADTYHWDFGDGETSALESPIHRFKSEGYHQVVLTATNSQTGQSANYSVALYTKIDSIDIKIEQPLDTVLLPGARILLTSISPEQLTYQWLLDGEIIPDSTQATIFATEAGAYQLVVRNSNGCESRSNIIRISLGEAFEQCRFVPPVYIPANDSVSYTLDVLGALSNDLAAPTQGLCEVKLNFVHNAIFDFEVWLTSPSGQTVQLIGPNSTVPGNTFGGSWNIRFVPCLETAQPDAPYQARWDNQINRFTPKNYTGSYYPYSGCLEDFNTGPVNGAWVLKMKFQPTAIGFRGVLRNFELTFCDELGRNCCFADAGQLSDEEDMVICEEESTVITPLAPTYQDAAPDPDLYDYAWLLGRDTVLLAYGNQFNTEDLPAGNYQLCGLSFEKSALDFLPVPNGALRLDSLRNALNGANRPFCGEMMDTCLTITILPAPFTLLDSSICAGDSVEIGSIYYSDEGTYFVPIRLANGCDSTVQLNLTIIPPKRTTIDTLIEEGKYVTIGGSVYGKEGVYVDTLQAENGCDSIVTLYLRVLPSGDCACASQLTLTLNPNTCTTRLTLDQAGLGGCSSSYTIIVADTYPSNGDIIDCPGEWTYGIFAQDGSLVCSGKVIAEDKSGPLLTGVDGRCDLSGKRQRAVLPAPPNALDPAALVWRDTFLCTDLSGIFNVDASWKDAAYRYYAGRPIFADGCQSCPCAVTVKATDQATYFQCETVRNDQIWARIARTFTATDCYGNQTQAVQEIYFLRPAIPENQQPDELVLRGDACSADVDSMIAELKKNYYLHDDPYACDAEARYAYFPEAGSGKTKRLECGYSFDVTVAGGDYEVCTGGRKVSVLVHYFDWCTGKPVVIDTILLKWYDAKGPSIALPEKPVVISTGPMDCTAAFGIDLASLKDFFGVEVTDNCGGAVTVNVELWSCVDSLLYGIPVEGKKWRKAAYQTMQMNGRLMALGVPVGAHKLRITAFDQCYNQSAKEVYFEVQDKIAPVVKCDDRLNVALTNSQGYPAAGTGVLGYAKVLASEIGEGASDNCGLDWIRVRRQYNPACLADFLARGYDSDNDGDIDAQDGIDWNQDGDLGDLMEKFEYSKVDPTILMTPALDYAEFFCCDLGAEGVMVELWAQDRYMEMSNCDGGTLRSGGNLSSCWTTVNLEDKVAPAFARPGDATIKCTDRELLDAISAGRAALSLNSPEYQYIEDRIFAAQDKGRFTILSGNECGNMELEAALIPDLHCDAGRVQIRYTGKKTIKGQPVLYPAGEAYIQVQPVHEYNLLFPEDLYGECEDLRDTANVVDGGELGCDVLAVNVSDKRYNGATLNGAPVAECYKIFRTFTVVNWCQYDEACGEPLQWAVVVPRDADGVNVLVRDADGDGEEAIYVEAGDTGDKVAQETERVTEFRFNNPENARCPHTNELFAWMYTQYIFVHDQEAPVVLDPGTQEFYLNKTACTGDVRFLIEAEDACAPATELQQQPSAAGNLAIERARLRLDTDNDPATPPAEPIELGSLGTILPAHTLHGDDKGANKWVFSGPALPEGYHTLLVAVRDDCGNLSAVREIPFSVVDTSVAAPICHHGLSTTLMKNPDTGTGEMTVLASDFVASPIDDCNGQGPKTGPTGKPLLTTYYVVKDNGDGIWDAADGLDTNGMPIIKSTSVTFTCDDAQLTQTAIRLYSEDARGNRAWCETYAVVTDPLGLCKNAGAIASVAGVIATENSTGVPEAEVSLSGGHSRFYETGKDGAYRFGGLKTGYDYSITPGLDRHPLDGVSTLDLIQIQKHILGIRPLGSPYKLLAADVNNSRSVSTLDLVQLRKLILGIETKFAHNTSWRFVDAAFLFPDPANPWKTAFPEVANINNLQADVKADFVAIKIGDVNGSALSNVQPRTSEAFRLNVEDLELNAGNEYRIAFTGEVSQIEGYQFTLGFDRNTVELADIEYGAAGAEHFGVFAKEGLITASWDEAQGARRKAQGDTLFTLVVKAKTDATSLRDVLSINSRITHAEAYSQGGDYLNIELALRPKRLNAQTPFALYQNIPNPFSGETLIGFWLPEAGEATLTIRDVTGRTLRVVRGQYAAGYNQVLLKSEDLRGRGLLFYSLTSGAFRATRRMVVE